MKELFDKYNLRARLSPMVILISPILLNMYLLVEEVRELSTTIVVAITAGALINLLILFSRHKASKVNDIIDKKNSLAQEVLSPLNDDIKINKLIKQRYYDFINSNVSYINLSFELEDETVIKQQCNAAITWLRERARNDERFKLVEEEGINTGFCKNMYGVKNYGISINIILVLIIGIYNYIIYGFNISSLSIETLLCIGIDIAFLIIWVFVVNKDLINFVYRKYTIALLATCDKV